MDTPASTDPQEAALKVIEALLMSIPWSEVDASHRREVVSALARVKGAIEKVLEGQPALAAINGYMNAVSSFGALVRMSGPGTEREELETLASKLHQVGSRLRKGSVSTEEAGALSHALGAVIERVKK